MNRIKRRSRSTETLNRSRLNRKCNEISNCCPGRRAQQHSHYFPPGAGPVGVIEKILEYRPLQQLLPPGQNQAQGNWLPVGWSGIEIRRFAPSSDGLVEYRQVIGPEVSLAQRAYLGLASSASACPLMAPPVGWQDRSAAAQGQPPHRHRQHHHHVQHSEMDNVEFQQRVKRNGSFPDLARASREVMVEADTRPSRDRDRRRHVQMPFDPSATYPYSSSQASRHIQTAATSQHVHHVHHIHHVPKAEEERAAQQEPHPDFSGQKQLELQRELQKELERELEHRKRSKSASSVIRDSGAGRSRDLLPQPEPPHLSQDKSPSVHSKLSFQVPLRSEPPSHIHPVSAKLRAKPKILIPEDFQRLPSSETLPPPYEFDGSSMGLLPQHVCGLEKQPVEQHRRPRDRSRDTLRSDTTSVDRTREKYIQAKALQEERDLKVREDRERVRLQQREQERRARRDKHEKERLEHEKKERERLILEKQERERIDQERREQERRQREKLELERKEQERLLLIEAEKRERERRERERQEHERQVREHLERERARQEQEKREKERLEKEKREKEKREKIEREKQEKLKREKRERLELEKIEQLRKEQDRIERERLEHERREKERLEYERRERERKENERREKERLERLEKERRERERLEHERIKKERLEKERLEIERLERERARKELEMKMEEERIRERERQIELERKELERQRDIERRRKEQEQIRRDREEREKREKKKQREREERERRQQKEDEQREHEEYQKMQLEMEERDRRIAKRALEKHKEAQERARLDQTQKEQEEKEKLIKEMADKERVAKMMADKERKAIEKADKLRRESKIRNGGSYLEGDVVDDVPSLSPEKLAMSWDRRSRKRDERRLSEDKRYSRRPASIGQSGPVLSRHSLERRARSDDQRYRSSKEDLTHPHSPSISPPCTCDIDSEGESHNQETVREIQVLVSEMAETPSLFSPPSRHSTRDGKPDLTSWDRRSGGKESRSTVRTLSKSHGRASAASSGAYIIEAETHPGPVFEDERRHLVSTPKVTSPRSRSRPATRERRRGSSGGTGGTGRKSVGRPRSHSGGPDRHILHYPHHFDSHCEVHDMSADGRRSAYDHQRYGSYADFKCLSPEHVTNGRAHHPGLNGSSKSLTSTHPMITRGASTERFSPLDPRDFEVESLSRKTNNIIIFKGLKFRRQHWFFMGCVGVLLIFALALGISLSRGSGASLSQSPELRDAAVVQLLAEVPLVDGHNDLPWNIRKFVHNKLETVNFTENLKLVDPWSKSKWSHTDLLRLSQGKVGCQLWVAYAPCGAQHKDAVQVTLEQIDLIKRFIEAYPKQLQLVKTSQELEESHLAGRIGSLITVESGHSIGTSLAVLRMFHRLGARSLTLTHNCNTPWADCSKVDIPGNEPEHNGLTQFGRTVVEEMNRLGMIVDLSHSSLQTARDTLAVSDAPVIFSHSSAQAICNSSRNVPDNLLRLVAERKGLVMVNFFSYFLTCSNHSTILDVVAHLNHIRKIAGIDYVGIGASYDGINSTPSGLEDVSKYPALFASLLASGAWSLEDLKKLAGLNFLRVFREVEKVSRDYYKQKPNENVIPGKDIADNTECKTEYK